MSENNSDGYTDDTVRKPEAVSTDGPTGQYECFDCHFTWRIGFSTSAQGPVLCPVCRSTEIKQVGP